MCVAYQSEEHATGFLVYVDNLIVERDAAQQESAELRKEIAEHLLRADSLRAELARQVDEHEAEATELHNVIADLRRELGIIPNDNPAARAFRNAENGDPA